MKKQIVVSLIILLLIILGSHEYPDLDPKNISNIDVFFGIKELPNEMIDSDLAYDIVMKNEESREQIKKAKKFSSFSLSRAEFLFNKENIPCWRFEWIYDETPFEQGDETLYISVDAKTGEVFEIEVYH